MVSAGNGHRGGGRPRRRQHASRGRGRSRRPLLRRSRQRPLRDRAAPRPEHPRLGNRLAARIAVGELSRARPVRPDSGGIRDRRRAGGNAAPNRDRPRRRVARRLARDRLCRPLRQCDDRAARDGSAGRRPARRRRADVDARADLFRCRAGFGLLVRELEWSGRNRGQWRAGLTPRSVLRSARRSQSSPDRGYATGGTGMGRPLPRRHQPLLAAALEPVKQADPGRDHDKNTEHPQAELPRNVPEHGAKGVAEKIADRDKARRPQRRGKKIEHQKPAAADGAHSHRERGEVAHPVDKAKRQDEGGVVALEPAQRGVNAGAPAREAVEQLRPEMAADPEPALVADKAAETGRRHQQKRVQQSLRRSETGEDHNCLAFKKSPDKRDQVKPGAVLRDQPIKLHPRPMSCLSERRDSCGARMLVSSPARVERDFLGWHPRCPDCARCGPNVPLPSAPSACRHDDPMARLLRSDGLAVKIG